MLKILASLFLLLVLSLSAEEKSYVFEAKGKFAEDLKALVEKYSKDGKVDVTVYESKDGQRKKPKSTTQTILSVFTNNDAEELKYADVDQGKVLYQKECAQCHGKNADENTYSVPHKLSQLKPMQILNLLEGYRANDDGSFGGSLRAVMRPHAANLTGEEMQSLAVYIYSIKHSGEKLPVSEINNSANDENTNEAKSSYLQ
jgi:cytochrome c553